jgi:hypothetical protein
VLLVALGSYTEISVDDVDKEPFDVLGHAQSKRCFDKIARGFAFARTWGDKEARDLCVAGFKRFGVARIEMLERQLGFSIELDRGYDSDTHNACLISGLSTYDVETAFIEAIT